MDDFFSFEIEVKDDEGSKRIRASNFQVLDRLIFSPFLSNTRSSFQTLKRSSPTTIHSFKQQIESKIVSGLCCLPLSLQERNGWNTITLDLRDITRKAFGTTFSETLRVFVSPLILLFLLFLSSDRRLMILNDLLSDPRQLPSQTCLLFRETLFRR